MLANSKAFSGFAVDDLDKARHFYGETLGLNVELLDAENGLLSLHHPDDRATLAYLSPDMTPPSYTILNFPVDDIDQAVDELASRGVSFEQYGNDQMPQDEKGVMREGGPLIAGSRTRRATRCRCCRSSKRSLSTHGHGRFNLRSGAA